jgi:Rap1a immunity proteins
LEIQSSPLQADSAVRDQHGRFVAGNRTSNQWRPSQCRNPLGGVLKQSNKLNARTAELLPAILTDFGPLISKFETILAKQLLIVWHVLNLERNRTMGRFVLPLILLAMVPSAKAQNLAGDWLYSVCNSADQQGQLICKMWISGFQSGMFSSQQLARANKLKPATCIPNNVTGDQARLIVQKFMSDNPKYRQLSAELVAAYALEIAFPCP